MRRALAAWARVAAVFEPRPRRRDEQAWIEDGRATPLVSVALAVKNGMPYLKDAIDGLCRQTYRNTELVVQDARSTDGSLEYLRGLQAPFPVRLVSASDSGLAAGYNRAVRRCKGDLMVCAGCDEVHDADALARYVSWYVEHPRAVFIYGGMRIVDASGTVTDFQPPAFDLLDFLRHRMCPTEAGVYNRRLLGSDLRYDESLGVVPEFELWARLALRFGDDRLVCKNAITMSARGDAASMTYRPEAYAQIVRAKRAVIERLVRGPLRPAFSAYLRSEMVADMHGQIAEFVYGLAGDGPVFREHVLAALVERPGLPQALLTSRKSRHFAWDERARRLIVRVEVPPLPPPAGETTVAQRLPLASIRSEPQWEATGAAVESEPGGVRVRTPPLPWAYSAVAPLEPGAFDLREAWYWLKVTVAEVEGGPRLALFDPASNGLQHEAAVAAGADSQDVFFELYDPAYTGLLVRNGGDARASSLLVRSVEVLTMPVRRELAVRFRAASGPEQALQVTRSAVTP